MRNTLRNVGRPQHLYIEAMQSIKEAIFRGDFEPGQTLPSEMDLAGLLGVSRPVLREALRVLQIQGFLDVRRGNRGGTYVTDLSNISIKDNLKDLIRMGKMSMQDLTQARLLIEPEIFRLAARNASQQQLAELAVNLKEVEGRQDVEHRVRYNVEFHRMVAKASGNLLYMRFIDNILSFVESFALTIKPTNFRIHGDRDHADIYEALVNRDAESAGKLAKKHIEDVTNKMARLEKEWLQVLRGDVRTGE